MADKVRGKLNQIDWSKSNQVSINVNKKKPSRESSSKDRPSTNHTSENGAAQSRAAAPLTSPRNDVGELPVNRYQSVVAPVKSGREEERPPPRRVSADAGNVGNRRGSRRSTEGSEDSEDGAQVYLGYIGSLRVPPDSMSTGIKAIQRPMSGLYFPYREKQTYAQERIITLTSAGLEVYYLPDQDADEPASFVINCQDILYVEPLRFTTRKTAKDRKVVLAAFEPCEAQRVALLGNRDSLFEPLSKQHKHISLLKHPALLCMVIRSPHSPTELFTHGYVCGTVEEAVFLARQVRDELEVLHREYLKSNEQPPSVSNLSASHMSISSDIYKIDKHSASSSKMKQKSKKKKLEKRRGAREAYTTHTGDDEDDLGTYHFGMLHSTGPPASQFSPNSSFHDVMEEPVNDNFLIGQPGRRQSRNSSSSDYGGNSFAGGYSNGRPVGVVQPQSSAARDGFKVLPSDVQMNRSNLKPTALNVKSNRFSDVTPELDLKLRMRQQEDSASTSVLGPMAPRSVVNPLAEADPELNRRSFLSPTPGPISKMSTSLPFKPAAAMPQSGWHEPVLGNFKSKEEIDNRLNSEMVDPRQLPKMESDKKEQEIANLFSSLDVNATASQEENNNFSMKAAGPASQLHEAMGFMP